MNGNAGTNLIIIPARMAATRLPGKPLREIAGEPMIIHVWRRAMEANLGPVVIATDAPEIKDVVENHGGQAVLTDPAHASGSDRIYEALITFDGAGNYKNIINLQGDLPTLDPALISACAELLKSREVDISTLAVEKSNEA